MDTTLSILKMSLLGFISFLFVQEGKNSRIVQLVEIHSIFVLFYFLFFNFYFYFLISSVLLPTCIIYNKINKVMEVYSLPCLKKKKKKKKKKKTELYNFLS